MKIQTPTIFGLVAIVTIIAFGCSDKPVVTSPPHSFFPQQQETPNAFMDALLVGKLELVNNCLRIKDKNNDSNYLLIWPQGFSLHVNDNIIEVVGEKDQLIAQVGDNLRVSGGEMSAQYITEYISQPLPEDCPGPYWIVGDEITR